jgi:hypothetical protein
MKSLSTFILFFLSCLPGFAQMKGTGRIVVLHPSLGQTITLAEKKEFGLFPNYPDSIFETASIVKYNDSLFSVLYKDIHNSALERTISQSQLYEIYLKVEKAKPAPPPVVSASPKSPGFLQTAGEAADVFSETFVKTLQVILIIFRDFNILL